MVITNTLLDIKMNYPLHQPYSKEDILFFDIETTGFSANTSILYLIGYMYYKENTWHLQQLLADDKNSEFELIETFTAFIKKYKRIIHYNGSGFDIPYLLRKCKQYGLENPFIKIESFDLYKNIMPYKKILGLTNLKLKTVEAFLNIHRTDKFSGEELIQVYANFIGKLQFEKLQKNSQGIQPIKAFSAADKQGEPLKSLQARDLANLILLHNQEDIIHLPQIGELLFYKDIFEKGIANMKIFNECEELGDEIQFDTELLTYETRDGSLYFNITQPYSYPLSLNINAELLKQNPNKESVENNITPSLLKILLRNNRMTLSTPIFNGELKHFLTPHTDYYYLPKEDSVIHKSVAQYVDKEFREKAKPANCYLKKESEFVPQPEELFFPSFRANYEDKIHYVEFKELVRQSPEMIQLYLNSLIKYFKTYFNIKK